MDESPFRPAPIIVSALFGPEDFAYLDGLRQAHFPAERNQLSAHLTLFHHLPPSAASELRAILAEEARAAPLAAELAGIMNLGRGVALRVRSEALNAIRQRLAESFRGLLTPQDAGGWRPHITIQNKALPADAKNLLQELSASFRARPLVIAGLAAYFYRGGPWELIARYPFRGARQSS